MISAEIIEIEEELSTSNIIVWVCFLKDSVEIEWPKTNPATGVVANQTKNGRNVFPLYADVKNFVSKTSEEQAKWIQINVEDIMGRIILNTSKPIVNSPIITEISKLIGTVYQKDTVDVIIDINGTGVKRVVSIKDDGTTSTVREYTEAAIITGK